MRNKKFIALMMTTAMAVGCLAGCGQKAATGTEVGTEAGTEAQAEAGAEDSAEAGTEAEAAVEEELSEEDPGEAPTYDYIKDYNLVWEDNFDGDSLNRDDWNVELHEPGWVNEEWQEYVDSEENIKVSNGTLKIIPVQKDNGDGTYSYTSGRITTQNKHDYTYGLFEARLKVPVGKGYLPAFWLMATDENVYGQWPRCGEIDIMEVLGDKPKEAHGTIHYGNPHGSSQGTYTIKKLEDFVNTYHTFACEWNPGEIVWYIDGKAFHRENDWYSTTEGQGTLTYPAPFDQPFYMILNLAVGGSWVGYPDESTVFSKNNNYTVDYVRVYQKDEYDENVELVKEEVVLRDPNPDGNYINNSTFSEEEDLNDGKDWKFLLAQGGKGTATIADNTMTIESEAEGSVDYSVQLVQPNVPMEKGSTYEISFDAYASEARKFNLAVKAPDRNWIEYFETTPVDITTDKKNYTFEFTMKDDSDPNGRLEYNMGAAGSTGTIYLSNVSVKKTGEASADSLDEGKSILADGNFIYNGKFQEGPMHLGSWEVKNNKDAAISVTDFADGRRLKVEAAEGTTADDVIIYQEDLAFGEGSEYILSFSAEVEKPAEIKVIVGGNEFVQALTAGKKDYTITLPADTKLKNGNFSMSIGTPGTILIDDVRLVESAMIMNGSFNAGFAGYEWFCDASANASYVVDALSEDNALDVTINDTGSADWNVQIMQKGITLEKGKSYVLTFDAKSSKDRDVYVLLQGLEGLGWPEYSGKEAIHLTADYQTVEIPFTMEAETDAQAFLSICLGAVDGQIKDQHRIVMDNFVLVEK